MDLVSIAAIILMSAFIGSVLTKFWWDNSKHNARYRLYEWYDLKDKHLVDAAGELAETVRHLSDAHDARDGNKIAQYDDRFHSKLNLLLGIARSRPITLEEDAT